MTTIKIEEQVKTLSEFKDEIVPGAVKLATKEAGASSGDLYSVPYQAIKIRPGYNPRLDTEEYHKGLQELADSIKANGFYRTKAIACVVASENGKNVLYVEDGHRRYAAFLLAFQQGAEISPDLPVIVLPRGMSAEERLVHMLKSNNDGVRFNALELAILAQRFIAFGKTEKEAAEAMGFTTTYIKQLLTLASSPKEIRDMVKAGEISPTFAIETVAKHKDKAVAVVKETVKNAKAKGKKATAKMTAGEAEAKSIKAQKKHAVEAFKLLQEVFDKHGKHIDSEFHTRVDALLFECGVV